MKKVKANNKKGFTLVELLVVVAIIGFVSSVVISNFPKFRNQISLNSFAQDLALSIRKAQVYGISVKDSGQSTNPFKYGYGVHFDLTNSNSQKTIKLFFDNGGTSDYYDKNDTTIESFTPVNGNSILSICEINSVLIGSSCNSYNTADIVFKRPNPDAIIKQNISSTLTDMSEIRIVLTNNSGLKRTITVYSTGQISVSNES